ncbi:MAG: glycosyltransferase [Bacteroidales bacterium]|jgi:glycosyltransferase involved in cell wall biosynthesis|nr:glycosyltransferase [Bacteroidales bacterium]
MEEKCLNINNEIQTNSNPLVSVVTIAYNVEKFIVECIESVLIQKTNFSIELVIGEDCSTDNTRKICLEYQDKYPNIIKVLLHKKNLGLTPNCIATHNACTGKYIALLDGDDYWTDDKKLQKQIDFLENNSDYSGCGHQSLKIYENGEKSKLFGYSDDTTYYLNDMITHRKFHTSSFVYRKEIWDKTGGIPPSISSNERAIYPMVAIFGKIKYFKENMCVYRIAATGLNSRVNYKDHETDFEMLPWLKKIDSKFPIKKFSSFLHLCNYTYGQGVMPFKPLFRHYFLFAVLSFSYFPQNLGDLKWGTIFFIRRLKK